MVVMKTPSPLPRSTTLVSPATSATFASSHAWRIDAAIRSSSGNGKALLEDEGRCQVERPCPADGQVVDRAVNRQLADVAAGKEERTDHERIGGDGDPRRIGSPAAGQADGCLVFERGQHVVAVGGQKQPLDELGTQEPAAAVAEHDAVVRRDRQRAGAVEFSQPCHHRSPTASSWESDDAPAGWMRVPVESSRAASRWRP